MMAARMAGRLGCGGGPARLFPPLRRGEAAVLEKGVGEHRHERVSVQPGPGSALEVVEAERLLELLVGLLAGPARLDGGRERVQAGVGGKIAGVVLRLAGRPALADDPRRLAGEVLRGMPTAQCSPLSLSPARNVALMP